MLPQDGVSSYLIIYDSRLLSSHRLGNRMLNRLSASALLKAVIGVMAACVVAVLSVSGWASWQRLQTTGRISVIAEASASAFKAMHNLRNDRPSTNRLLSSDQVIQPDMASYLRTIRGDEMPAMRATAELLPAIDFADKETLIPALSRLVQTLTALHAESWEAMSQPKASRRPGLLGEYMETAEVLLRTLETVSARLAAAVNHNDPVIDQLLSIKQAAWLFRSMSGEASLLLASALPVGRMEARQNYTKFVGGIETAWAALELAAAGSKLPSSLVDALAMAKTASFDPQYLALRDRIANALVSGENAEINASQWSPITVGRMATAVTVAESALEQAKIRASAQWSLAREQLILQLSLLAGALALASGSMMTVGHRVINPLHAIRDAMLKVAAGDLSVDAGYAERRDEIGALAGALGVFKQQAIEKARIEQHERDRNLGAAARQQAIEAHIAAFEAQIRQALNALDTASDQMRTTSDDMSLVSDRTNTQVHQAAKASGGSLEQRAECRLRLGGVERIDQRYQPAGDACRKYCQSRRRYGPADRRHRSGTFQNGKPYRRSGWPDQRNRLANKPSGIECNHRGRARGRRRQGICRGCIRGQIARRPDRKGDRRNIGTNRGCSEGCHGGHPGHQGNRRNHQ